MNAPQHLITFRDTEWAYLKSLMERDPRGLPSVQAILRREGTSRTHDDGRVDIDVPLSSAETDYLLSCLDHDPRPLPSKMALREKLLNVALHRTVADHDIDRDSLEPSAQWMQHARDVLDEVRRHLATLPASAYGSHKQVKHVHDLQDASVLLGRLLLMKQETEEQAEVSKILEAKAYPEEVLPELSQEEQEKVQRKAMNEARYYAGNRKNIYDSLGCKEALGAITLAARRGYLAGMPGSAHPEVKKKVLKSALAMPQAYMDEHAQRFNTLTWDHERLNEEEKFAYYHGFVASAALSLQHTHLRSLATTNDVDAPVDSVKGTSSVPKRSP